MHYQIENSIVIDEVPKDGAHEKRHTSCGLGVLIFHNFYLTRPPSSSSSNFELCKRIRFVLRTYVLELIDMKTNEKLYFTAPGASYRPSS